MSKGKRIKRALIIMVVIILSISSVFFIGLQIMLQRFSNEVSNIEINNIDLSIIDDGVYIGEYHVNDSVGAIVQVTVNNNIITDINFIEHKYGKGKKAEAITARVIDSQSLQVDAISGATGSSTIILKAIENALLVGISE